MSLTVVKIGGHVIDEQDSLKAFLHDFTKIEGPKILIHGGGKVASQLGEQLGIEAKLHEGRRITDEATRDLVTMVYGGLLNKQIVSRLQALEVNAIGLTGADGNLLKATRRPVEHIDFGFVGDVRQEDVNVMLIEQIVSMGMVPVIPALTHDGQANMLNTNADTMAAIIASAMCARTPVTLCYCFEHPGVMRDMENGIVISTLSEKEVNALHRKGVIHSGMLPKLQNAIEAHNSGVDVRIGHFENLEDMIKEKNKGTTIK